MKTEYFFKRVGNTRVIPIAIKIVVIFTLLLVASNFANTYIAVSLSRKEIMEMLNTLLVRELKELYTNAGNQYQIVQYSNDTAGAFDALVKNAEGNFTHKNSWVAGIKPDGAVLFASSAFMQKVPDGTSFSESKAFIAILQDWQNGITEGARFFHLNQDEFFGVYKYHDDWDVFLIRADLMSEMTQKTNSVFSQVSLIIVGMSIIFVIVGFIAMNRILRFVHVISDALLKMQTSQKMDIIDLSHAPNDDITYLGISFNALSSTINTLLSIFRKFTTQDIVNKVYNDMNISLGGKQRELTILFSDIREFTHMTEVLGNDVINLLNLHYEKAINEIHNENGIIGSIIGDALMAVYGAVESTGNKSLEALNSGWALQNAAADMRKNMAQKRAETEKERALDKKEKEAFDAVMLDIGVGIDGGTVFYGTIGSHDRMTNTVIGDNVNSSARLEGLTRIYRLPIIVSDYIKDEVSASSNRYRFIEVDTVLVKGKVNGKRIWYPLDTLHAKKDEIADWEVFSRALALYYKGEWGKAAKEFAAVQQEIAQLFLLRIESSAKKSAPEGWNGVWTMTTK
ncbi:MAG: hypothetical protein Ta2A_08730 [Treponemataceae bacterium]|nr:MAG: hypothetical protein Ta2A_08730 [Treponemataceae bacterium]